MDGGGRSDFTACVPLVIISLIFIASRHIKWVHEHVLNRTRTMNVGSLVSDLRPRTKVWRGYKGWKGRATLNASNHRLDGFVGGFCRRRVPFSLPSHLACLCLSSYTPLGHAETSSFATRASLWSMPHDESRLLGDTTRRLSRLLPSTESHRNLSR